MVQLSISPVWKGTSSEPNHHFQVPAVNHRGYICFPAWDLLSIFFFRCLQVIWSTTWAPVVPASWMKGSLRNDWNGHTWISSCVYIYTHIYRPATIYIYTVYIYLSHSHTKLNLHDFYYLNTSYWLVSPLLLCFDLSDNVMEHQRWLFGRCSVFLEVLAHRTFHVC